MNARFINYRARLFELIALQVATDLGHKSYEGTLRIIQHYPNYFEGDKAPTYELALDCYVLGPTRHYSWVGDSLDQCLDQAEAALIAWEAEP